MTATAIFKCLKSDNHLKTVCLQIPPAPFLIPFNVYFAFVVSQSLWAPEIVAICLFLKSFIFLPLKCTEFSFHPKTIDSVTKFYCHKVFINVVDF